MTESAKPSHEGYLKKKGPISYKKRYFILRGTLLEYYKDIRDLDQALGNIDMNVVTLVRRDARKKDATFEIHTPYRIYYLKAEEDNDAATWVDVLNNALTEMKASNRDIVALRVQFEELKNLWDSKNKPTVEVKDNTNKDKIQTGISSINNSVSDGVTQVENLKENLALLAKLLQASNTNSLKLADKLRALEKDRQKLIGVVNLLKTRRKTDEEDFYEEGDEELDEDQRNRVWAERRAARDRVKAEEEAAKAARRAEKERLRRDREQELAKREEVQAQRLAENEERLADALGRLAEKEDESAKHSHANRSLEEAHSARLAETKALLVEAEVLIATQQSQIESLQRDDRLLRRELESARQSNELLRAENNDLEGLRAESKSLREQWQLLHSEASHTSAAAETFRAEASEAKGRTEYLRAEVQRLENDLQVITSKYDEESKSHSASLASTIEELEREREKVEREKEKVERERERAERERERAEEERREREVEKETFLAEKLRIESELREKGETRDGNEQERLKIAGLVALLQKRCEDAERQREDLRRRCEGLEEELRAHEHATNAMTRALQQNQQELRLKNEETLLSDSPMRRLSQSLSSLLGSASPTDKRVSLSPNVVPSPPNSQKNQGPSSTSNPNLLEEEVERLREAVKAHQVHNTFLAGEVQRIELHLRSQLAAKASTVEALQRQLSQYRADNVHRQQLEELDQLEKQLQRQFQAELQDRVRAGEAIDDTRLSSKVKNMMSGQNLSSTLPNSAGDQDTVASLQRELESLKKMYFSSLALGIKLSFVSKPGQKRRDVNIDTAQLYEEILASSVPYAQWSKWINNQMEKYISTPKS
eukprot:TRINITY_DN2783_c0_g1_i1.p1 TRINITY_DN2783_c0_g1~~TRINITY_DN2783_c0_g1_i1.p1  ORF type:complete len:836 (+),score=248.75 TRINITY_DN2783_c0_g1_i1:3-2510(+)